MRLGTSLLTVVFVLRSLLASGGQVRERDAAWIAPPGDASKLNPLANRADVAPGGRKLFQRYCSTCHGEDARGSTKGPDLTHRDVQAQTDGALFWKVSGGNAHQGMPSFSFLPRPQRWQLVLHVRSASLGQ
jgi:mono/diheme cytochrome c family protein